MFRMLRAIALLMLLAMTSLTAFAQDKAKDGNAAADAELVEARREIPKLKAAATYEPKGDTIEIELSEYAGYSGLIAANGGLEPNAESYFFKKHGFKVKFTLSEEESWSALNSGRMAASATTADVLAAYGKQFEVNVPALIGFSRGADGIVVRNNIKRINDLKGKIVSACQFTESDFFIRYLAQEAGLGVNLLDDFTSPVDPNKVNIIVCADGFGADHRGCRRQRRQGSRSGHESQPPDRGGHSDCEPWICQETPGDGGGAYGWVDRWQPDGAS